MKFQFLLPLMIILSLMSSAFGQGVTQPGDGTVKGNVKTEFDNAMDFDKDECDSIKAHTKILKEAICFEFDPTCKKVSDKEFDKILDDALLKKIVSENDKINIGLCPECQAKDSERKNRYSDLKKNLDNNLKKSCEQSKQDELKNTIEKLDKLLEP